jgi:hypothetical protein
VSGVTVTFGSYNHLYSLENDMLLLQGKPFYKQHYFCLVIQRGTTTNWRTMVYHCCKVLQIQLPWVQKKKCHRGTSIVLMGWQQMCLPPLTHPLLVSDPLPLVQPLYLPQKKRFWWNKVTKFNNQPVYLHLSSVQKETGTVKKKRARCRSYEVPRPLSPPAVTCVRVPTPPPLKVEVEAQVPLLPAISSPSAGDEHQNNPFCMTEEDWVMTAVCSDD